MSDRSSQTYTVTIPHPPPLMIDLVGSLGPFYVGDQIQTGFAAFGGAGPYTWVASGNIPTGLTFSGGGLMGTATTPGSYTFSVTVTDLVGTSTSQSYTISILLKVSLTASRGSLLFFYHEGTVPPASQSFTVSSATRLDPIQLSIGGVFDSVGISSTATPSVITVAVNPIGLVPKTYKDTITVSARGATSPVSVDVSLLVTPQKYLRGDVDGNGVPDQVLQNDQTRQVVVWYMGGAFGNNFLSGGYLSPNDMTGWSVVAVKDVDGDGLPDLVWQNDNTREVDVWYMGGPFGTTFLSSVPLAPVGMQGWTVVGMADLNGDGHPDLVWQNDITQDVFVWFLGGSMGNTYLGSLYLSPAGMTGWKVVGLADMNGDGHPDVIWQNNQTQQVFIWYLGGSLGTIYQGGIYLSPPGMAGWSVVGVVDLNGDGHPDIVWQDGLTRQVFVWYLGTALGNVYQGALYIDGDGHPGWTVKDRF